MHPAPVRPAPVICRARSSHQRGDGAASAGVLQYPRDSVAGGGCRNGRFALGQPALLLVSASAASMACLADINGEELPPRSRIAPHPGVADHAHGGSRALAGQTASR